MLTRLRARVPGAVEKCNKDFWVTWILNLTLRSLDLFQWPTEMTSPLELTSETKS